MRKLFVSFAALLLLLAGQACSQAAPTRKTGGSPNVQKLSNIPLRGYFYTGCIGSDNAL